MELGNDELSVFGFGWQRVYSEIGLRLLISPRFVISDRRSLLRRQAEKQDRTVPRGYSKHLFLFYRLSKIQECLGENTNDWWDNT